MDTFDSFVEELGIDPSVVVIENGKAAPVEETEIVGAVESFISKYLVLPDRTALLLALWTVCTYLYDRFDTMPYLGIVSPAKRCGKTRLAEVLGCVARNPILTTGITEAALFRLVDQGGVTLLLDEAEALRDKRSERSQAIISILNAGYRKGAYVYRCVPPKHDLQPFSVFGPKAVIAIGTIPDTVSDRAIVIRMRRRKVGETVGRYLARRAEADSGTLRESLAMIAQRRGKDIGKVYEMLPPMSNVSDRDEEILQPLFAVCSVLAPERLKALQESALAMSRAKAEADADDSLPMRLLADINSLMESVTDDIPSADLVAALKGIEAAPWSEPGRELTANRLARMLAPFGVSTRNIRTGMKVVKGYVREQLLEAVALYIGSGTATGATEQ